MLFPIVKHPMTSQDESLRLVRRRGENKALNMGSVQPRNTVVSDDAMLLGEAYYTKIIALQYTLHMFWAIET